MSTIATAYIQIEPSTKGIGNKLQKSFEEEGSNAGKGFNLSFGKIIGGAALAGIAAKGAQMAVGVVKSAISGYGEYEQLVGGVETLFGNSADAVIKNANVAFQTAGMSANEYMETVTSFSASLLQSLDGDTDAAAKSADTAIQDMADNANKMGTSMESIQNAYQGFAKQNYTMLDNLKLGYGGTKGEMQRLLEDATAISGIDYNIDSLSDVYEAIHVIQGELGITGTTSKEAATTIQGSLSSMKSAWSNLVTGLATDGANLDELINTFMSSFDTFAGNIMPVVQTALDGLIQLIVKIGPEIVTLLINTITANLPMLLEAGINIIAALVTAILQSLPQLIAAIPQILLALKNAFIAAAPQLKEAGIKLVEMLKTAIQSAWNAVLTLAGNLMARLKEAFFRKVQQFKDIGKNIVDGIKNGISEGWNNLKNYVSDLASSLLDSAKSALGIHSPSREFANQIGKQIPAGIAMGIQSGMGVLNSAIDAMAADTLTQTMNAGLTAEIGASSLGSVQGEYAGTGLMGGYNQTVNIYSPEALSPSEIARQTRNSTRNMVLSLRGV